MELTDEMIVLDGVRYRPDEVPARGDDHVDTTRVVGPTAPEFEEVEEKPKAEAKVDVLPANRARTTRAK